MIPEEKIQQILDRHDYLQHAMSNPSEMAGESFAKVSKEFSDLGPVVEKATELRDLASEMADLAEMMTDEDSDAEMRGMAEDEFHEAKAKIPKLEKELSLLLLPKDAADDRSSILEIRAGTGGDEAALFAGDLYRMYQRYAEIKGWKLELISSSAGEMGGYKEIVVNVKGKGVFARLKFESGVHRVQRVPQTESSGRIHTSAATVAVLPEPEEVDVEIEDKDIRIDVFRASGPGGQSVNTTDSAIRITHLATGLVVQQQDEKSQHKNKAKAMRVLRARLYDYQRAIVDAERAEQRKGQVGSGDRSERIRTYNFPQGRITDHRINLTLQKLDKVLAGEGLEEVITALIAEDQAAKLAAMEAVD